MYLFIVKMAGERVRRTETEADIDETAEVLCEDLKSGYIARSENGCLRWYAKKQKKKGG